MALTILLLFVGLALILVGANALVNGSSAIAQRYGISEFVIGLTIVGIGTSTPELVVSVISAIQGNSDIAIGNVVGSNISNVFLILGLTALIAPIPLTKSNIKLDIPISLAVSLLLFVLSYDTLFFAGGSNSLSRIDGAIFFAGFILFLYYSFRCSRDKEDISEEKAEKRVTEEMGDNNAGTPLLKAVVSILIGLAGLIFGGRLFVTSGSELASELGVSNAFIGITVMAVGTSLPELAASVVAAVKKKGQMALGNILGSNVFNILLILGTSSLIKPLTLSDITIVDMTMMIATSLLILLGALLIKKKTIGRVEGALFVSIYIGYVIYLALNLQ